jgi:LmbE family N-acetylglucosaminyl deacetylase
MKHAYALLFALLLSVLPGWAQQEKLRVIVIGAHPDDCDIGAGGLAALYASLGHHVKFVSMTNGDKGHAEMGGGQLARRRYLETQEGARRIGITYEVLENHDGELLPTLENRLEVIRRIREWKADIVISHRPYTYHPDHRYTGNLVLDAAYLVIVPNVLSSVPPLEKNPLFLYLSDGFQRPNAFRPDITIDISPVADKKVALLDAHVSQFYEWLPWTERDASVPASPEARKKWLLAKRVALKTLTPEVKQSVTKWYGKRHAARDLQLEAFEICEYGRRVSDADIRRLFPMLPAKVTD